MAERKGTKTVARHTPAVRVTHWLAAISGFALLFSGMGQLPMYRRYNVVKIPGLGWSDNYETTLVIHYLAAAVFTAVVLFHIVYHLRRRELAALPRRGDGVGSYKTIVAMLLGRPEPPAGKFLPEQRVAYAVIGAVSLLLVLTGMIKSIKNLGPMIIDPTLLQIVTLTHTASAVIFMLLIVAHVGALLIKANWPLVPSMFTGRVSRGYAEHRHPLWRFEGETSTHAGDCLLGGFYRARTRAMSCRLLAISTSFIRPPHRAQVSTSTEKTLRSKYAQGCLDERAGRPGEVAAEPLNSIPVLAVHPDLGVHIDPSHLGESVQDGGSRSSRGAPAAALLGEPPPGV